MTFLDMEAEMRFMDMEAETRFMDMEAEMTSMLTAMSENTYLYCCLGDN